LVKSSNEPGKITREYVIQANHKLISVFGGKWTTSRMLAKSVVKAIR
jgi:glycerol-3-phosphate dehydrogenase